jgi:hypothetical protein
MTPFCGASADPAPWGWLMEQFQLFLVLWPLTWLFLEEAVVVGRAASTSPNHFSGSWWPTGLGQGLRIRHPVDFPSGQRAECSPDCHLHHLTLWKVSKEPREGGEGPPASLQQAIRIKPSCRSWEEAGPTPGLLSRFSRVHVPCETGRGLLRPCTWEVTTFTPW